jgi:hypothetical protein
MRNKILLSHSAQEERAGNEWRVRRSIVSSPGVGVHAFICAYYSSGQLMQCAAALLLYSLIFKSPVLPVAAALVRDLVIPRIFLLAVEVPHVLGEVPADPLHLQRGREVGSLSAGGVTVRHQPVLELTAAALDGLLLP